MYNFVLRLFIYLWFNNLYVFKVVYFDEFIYFTHNYNMKLKKSHNILYHYEFIQESEIQCMQMNLQKNTINVIALSYRRQRLKG